MDIQCYICIKSLLSTLQTYHRDQCITTSTDTMQLKHICNGNSVPSPPPLPFPHTLPYIYASAWTTSSFLETQPYSFLGFFYFLFVIILLPSVVVSFLLHSSMTGSSPRVPFFFLVVSLTTSQQLSLQNIINRLTCHQHSLISQIKGPNKSLYSFPSFLVLYRSKNWTNYHVGLI